MKIIEVNKAIDLIETFEYFDVRIGGSWNSDEFFLEISEHENHKDYITIDSFNDLLMFLTDKKYITLEEATMIRLQT